MNFVLIEKKAFDLLHERLLVLSGKMAELDHRIQGYQPGNWLDSDSLCLALNLSKRSLQYYRSAGILPYSFIGKKIYYPAGKIKKLLDDGTIISKTENNGRSNQNR